MISKNEIKIIYTRITTKISVISIIYGSQKLFYARRERRKKKVNIF